MSMLCVCVRACVYAMLCVCVRACVYAMLCVCVRACVYICNAVRVRACMCVCVCMHVCVCACVCVYVVNVYKQADIIFSSTSILVSVHNNVSCDSMCPEPGTVLCVC